MDNGARSMEPVVASEEFVSTSLVDSSAMIQFLSSVVELAEDPHSSLPNIYTQKLACWLDDAQDAMAL